MKDGHPESYRQTHHHQGAEFDQADEQEFPFDDGAFRDGQQDGKDDVVRFPCGLEAEKDAQRHKKGSAQDRIARNQKHEAEGDKEIRDRRSAEPELLDQDITH